MSFFEEYNSSFTLVPKEGIGLRECQTGAVWAVDSYYTTADVDLAGIISMPTGSGKTVIMHALAFELKVKRVLIVSPTKLIRSQTATSFVTLSRLKTLGCIPDELPNVKVLEVKHRKKTEDEWEDILKDIDVVVAHPSCISPYFKGLAPIPAKLIDLIIIDEAHHEPAATWTAINDFYPSIKRIFLTATPFRRDRKRMKGKVIYHYPLERSISSGITRAIQFRGIESGIENFDQALINLAKEVFQEERKTNKTATFIAKSDRISSAVKLTKMYLDAGFNVDYIHSERSDEKNEEVIKKVQNNELDGFVYVGVASEGIDIPNTKIAILHSVIKSIPYTIQFLGRISRTNNDQFGKATLIANIDVVKGEVTKLYQSDQSWGDLVPELVDEQMRKARYFSSSQCLQSGYGEFSENIFFSTVVNQVSKDFKFKDIINEFKSPNFDVYYVANEETDEGRYLKVFTVSDKPIRWTNNRIYSENYFDLHIFYHHIKGNLLFEYTTSEEINSEIKGFLFDDLLPIPYNLLYKVLSNHVKAKNYFINEGRVETSIWDDQYIMIGMRNATHQTSSQPSYKTVLGTGVQTSIRSSEGRTFSAGHALIRKTKKKTLGIATKKGRIWSLSRGDVKEFISWCDELSDLILDGPPQNTLMGLSFLASTEPISEIKALPIAVLPPELFFGFESVIIQYKDFHTRNVIPEMTPIQINKETTLICNMKIDEIEIPTMMNLSNLKLWSVDEKYQSVKVQVTDRNDHSIEKTLEEILNDYPPMLVMPNGDSVEGRNRIIPNRSIEKLSSSVWITKNWENCNIQAERYQDNPVIGEPISIINKTIEFIETVKNKRKQILILDDGSHEISDLIWIDMSEKVISFIHCKASSSPLPGCRSKDADVLFAQVIRSTYWAYSLTLFRRIRERLNLNSKLILGNPTTLKTLEENFLVNEWDYRIIAVQPGFQISQVADSRRTNNNVYELACTVSERVDGVNASFEVWGS